MSKRALFAVTALLAAGSVVGVQAPAQAASSPVPGRFCKTADAGKVVTTVKYGKVKCLKLSNGNDFYDVSDIAGRPE